MGICPAINIQELGTSNTTTTGTLERFISITTVVCTRSICSPQLGSYVPRARLMLPSHQEPVPVAIDSCERPSAQDVPEAPARKGVQAPTPNGAFDYEGRQPEVRVWPGGVPLRPGNLGTPPATGTAGVFQPTSRGFISSSSYIYE